MKIVLDLLKADHIGVRELRTNLSRRLKTRKPLVITDHSQPVKVIVPYEDMLELLDILEEINDPKTRRLVALGRKSIKEGAKGIPVFKNNRS